MKRRVASLGFNGDFPQRRLLYFMWMLSNWVDGPSFLRKVLGGDQTRLFCELPGRLLCHAGQQKGELLPPLLLLLVFGEFRQHSRHPIFACNCA